MYDEQAVTAWQVEQLRRFEPLVVLGHDVNGEYGHGAHRLNAATLLKARNERRPGCFSPERRAVWDLAGAEVLPAPLAGKHGADGVGRNAAEGLGGKTALEMAAEGFACHASRTQWFQVKRKRQNDCRKFAWRLPPWGPDGQRTIFLNIRTGGGER